MHNFYLCRTAFSITKDPVNRVDAGPNGKYFIDKLIIVIMKIISLQSLVVLEALL